MLGQATLDRFFQVFPEYKEFYKEQRSVIEFPNGTRVFIRSTDEPIALEGMTLHWAWLDEAGMMRPQVFPIIRSRVSTTGGQVLITSTPYALNWLYRDVYLPNRSGEYADMSVFTWRSVDSPFFTAEFAEKERQRLSPEEYKRRYEGTFVKMQGLVWDFPDEQIFDTHGVLSNVLTYPDRVVAGVDWGFNNPSAIVIGVVKDAVFYVVDEWKESNKTTSEIIAQAMKMNAKNPVAMWYPDPADPSKIEEFRRAGLPIGTVDKDVSLGLSHVASLIRERRLWVARECKQLINEMSEYHYEDKDDRGSGRETPVKENDHLCDALRYMLMGYRPPNPVHRSPIRSIHRNANRVTNKATAY